MRASLGAPRRLSLATLMATFLVAFLSGCASPDATETTSTTPSTTPSSDDAPFAVLMTGCEAFHTFFPSPANEFTQFVPENFTMVSESGTVQIPVFGYDCDNSTAEMWALLPVLPPEALRNSSFAVDAVVLQAFTTNATSHAQYLEWGLDPARAVHADSETSEYVRAGVSSLDRLALARGAHSYELRTTVQESGGEFGAAAYRHWITNGTKATGWIEVHASIGRDLGAGTASFQSQGDPGAPPLAAGIGHRVSGVTLRIQSASA